MTFEDFDGELRVNAVAGYGETLPEALGNLKSNLAELTALYYKATT